MRRTIVLVVALVFLLVGVMAPAAQTAPSAEGALRASFNAYVSGGAGNSYASFAHGGAGAFHAATNAIDADFGFVEAGARRISPVGGDQTYCASNTFGIWVIIIGPDKAELQTEEFLIWFDGELLESTQTPFKRVADPQGFWFGGEEAWWWASIGVPVFGTLDPGEYELEASSALLGDFFAMITIEDC